MNQAGINIAAYYRLGSESTVGACALTIGNFDGCHLGHQKLIGRTLTTAKELNVNSASLTFSPRPSKFFHPEHANDCNLFTEGMKSRAFHEMNIGVHFVQTFSSTISNMTPDAFYRSILIDELHAKAVVVGENFRYGQNRAGDSKHLMESGKAYDVLTFIEESSKLEGGVVSSTKIREAIRAGDVSYAKEMLGRPYLLEGNLKKGDQLGRTLSFPTLNLDVKDLLVPANGVYAGFVWVKNVQSGAFPSILSCHPEAMPAAINVGVRPTVSGSTLQIEAHILSNFKQENTYETIAGFYFVERIRDEVKFQTLDELKHQMAIDSLKARSIL